MVSQFGPGSARAPKTSTEMWSDLARDAWKKGEAAADPAEACTWLERARRIVPADNTIALSLALARLRGGDNAGAQDLFKLITAQVDLSEAWLGLAATSMRMGNVPAAVVAMQAVLSRHASSPPVRILSANVANAAGLPGWCALDSAGRLHTDEPAELRVDAAPVAARWSGRGYRLPPGRMVSVSRNGVALLGSPIDRRAIDAVEGFVGVSKGDLVGWVWHPHNPDRDPSLLIAGKRIVARELMDFVETNRPLARPRRFRVAANDVPPGPVAVTTEDGQALLGSPLDSGLERRSAAGSEAGFRPVWADVVGPAPRVRPARTAIDVVIPVHGGREVTLACLESVLPTLRRGSRVHVVDDAGPDPLLAAELDRLASRKRIVLHRLPVNRGFPGAANVGLQAASGRDVVLLNSDTIVPPGWVEALAEAAYSAVDIGSACPLSNDATILSYPDATGGNPVLNPAVTAVLAQRANGDATVDIPVAVGFCMFIRHDCLADVGWLREDLFAQGYGEENDWSLRARHRGWRHVAVPGCFVAHHGGASFGGARRQLLARNAAILNRLHPGYDALIAEWIARDPLGPARRRIDVLRWRAGRQPSAVALITHAAGGGVDRVVTERAAALRQAGIRPIMIRPDGDRDACSVSPTRRTCGIAYRMSGMPCCDCSGATRSSGWSFTTCWVTTQRSLQARRPAGRPAGGVHPRLCQFLRAYQPGSPAELLRRTPGHDLQGLRRRLRQQPGGGDRPSRPGRTVRRPAGERQPRGSTVGRRRDSYPAAFPGRAARYRVAGGRRRNTAATPDRRTGPPYLRGRRHWCREGVRCPAGGVCGTRRCGSFRCASRSWGSPKTMRVCSRRVRCSSRDDLNAENPST